MAQSDTPAGETLQFDRVVTDPGGAEVPRSPAVVCAGCKEGIQTQYYDVNGNALCGTCRSAVSAAAETPTGMLPILKAAGLGAGAGIVGASVYYGVIAIAHLEIGIVAILIGYMVGYSVRKGADGRGGRRFQVLAAVLTYCSVALAYAPLAVQQTREAKAATATTLSQGSQGSQGSKGAGPEARPSGARILLGVVLLGGVIAALPVLVVVGSFPSGLISAVIIFIGMRQAWKMTGAPVLTILGPYRVGAPQAAAS
jgi:hypothetical protein